jgi:hypothetical protein
MAEVVNSGTIFLSVGWRLDMFVLQDQSDGILLFRIIKIEILF